MLGEGERRTGIVGQLCIAGLTARLCYVTPGRFTNLSVPPHIHITSYPNVAGGAHTQLASYFANHRSPSWPRWSSGLPTHGGQQRVHLRRRLPPCRHQFPSKLLKTDRWEQMWSLGRGGASSSQVSCREAMPSNLCCFQDPIIPARLGQGDPLMVTD